VSRFNELRSGANGVNKGTRPKYTWARFDFAGFRGGAYAGLEGFLEGLV
jgi:hypothetical protein